MAETQERTDSQGRAYAGSQLQIQIYVNRLQEKLNKSILDALRSLGSLEPSIRWTSPVESDEFSEYQDSAFLKAIGLEHLVDMLSDFWPKGGPVWDGLAVVNFTDNPQQTGVIMVEAKSHVPEVYGSGCQASERSKGKILAALDRTKYWLEVPRGANWTGPLYQSANRLAHLYFFREIAGIPAWFVNVLFVNDPHSPTSIDDWQRALPRIEGKLGLTNIDLPEFADVFLEATDRSLLVGTGE